MKNQYYYKILRQFAWLLPIGIAICMIPLAGTRVSPDGSLYLTQGLNIYLGNGYVEADGTLVNRRGAMFPWLVALYFNIFGVSVYSGMLLVRTFFVLNIATAYLYGRKLAGPFAGFMATLLVLTAFSLHRWSARVHLDIIMPFFMLAAMLLLYYAFDKKNIWLFVGASLSLGCAILTKEVALLLAPVPFLMWCIIPSYRIRKNIFHLLVFYFLLALIITPWLYRLVQDEEMFARVQRTSEWVLRSAAGIDPPSIATTPEIVQISEISEAPRKPLWVSLLKPITLPFNRLKTFYQDFLAKEFLLAPLFALAWCITLIRSIVQRGKNDVFLSLSMLCFMPIVLLLGAVAYRGGQVYFFYLLSFIVLAYQATALFQAINLSKFSQILILAWLVGIQIWVGDTRFSKLFTHQDSSGYVISSNSYGFGLFQDRWTLGNWHVDPIPEVGKWLNKNLTADEVVLSDWQWQESYYFYAEGKHPIHEIQYLSSQIQLNGNIRAKFPVRFLWTQAGRIDPSDALSHLLAFSESHFLSQVRELGARYIVTGQRRNFLGIYLRFHPDFAQVASFGDGKIQIFKVSEDAELRVSDSFPLFASNAVSPYLRNMNIQKDSHEYKLFVQTYLLDELGLTDQVVQNLETANIAIFTHNSIISPLIYAELIGQRDSLLHQTIYTYEQQTVTYPDNPFLYLDLAFLYEADERYESAHTSFTQAILLSGQEPAVLPSLVLAYREGEEHMQTKASLTDLLIASLQNAINRGEKDVQTYWQLADVYLLAKDWNNAHITYQQALKIWPNSAGTMVRIAQLYQSQKDFEKAKIAYGAALKMWPDDQELSLPADVHIEIGKISLDQASASPE